LGGKYIGIKQDELGNITSSPRFAALERGAKKIVCERNVLLAKRCKEDQSFWDERTD